MQSKFFAFMSRMKYINRWSLMRNTVTENIAEHSLNVSMIAHCLALIENKLYGGNYNEYKIGMLGVYHETSEVITGDLPTPIKYFSAQHSIFVMQFLINYQQFQTLTFDHNF